MEWLLALCFQICNHLLCCCALAVANLPQQLPWPHPMCNYVNANGHDTSLSWATLLESCSSTYLNLSRRKDAAPVRTLLLGTPEGPPVWGPSRSRPTGSGMERLPTCGVAQRQAPPLPPTPFCVAEPPESDQGKCGPVGSGHQTSAQGHFRQVDGAPPLRISASVFRAAVRLRNPAACSPCMQQEEWHFCFVGDIGAPPRAAPHCRSRFRSSPTPWGWRSPSPPSHVMGRSRPENASNSTSQPHKSATS